MGGEEEEVERERKLWHSEKKRNGKRVVWIVEDRIYNSVGPSRERKYGADAMIKRNGVNGNTMETETRVEIVKCI